jgi:hypothetical protein
MHNSLHIMTFDPLRDAPERCSLCEKRPPVFHFEFKSDADQKEPLTRRGFCCEICATRLLKKLERTESREWAEEEAALAAADLDTDDFHKRLQSLREVAGAR